MSNYLTFGPNKGKYLIEYPIQSTFSWQNSMSVIHFGIYRDVKSLIYPSLAGSRKTCRGGLKRKNGQLESFNWCLSNGWEDKKKVFTRYLGEKVTQEEKVCQVIVSVRDFFQHFFNKKARGELHQRILPPKVEPKQ